jgi:ABC-2 type transport system ATP-binding protein
MNRARGGGQTVTVEAWLTELAAELRRRRIEPAALVAEAATHLRDSGQPPLRVFGPPAAYAAAIAASLTGPTMEASLTGPTMEMTPPGEVRLEARKITKKYGRSIVLDSVNLTARAGEVVAIVGANGCGKSTLLRICAGLASPDSGEVRLRGTLGYCPQEGGVADYLTPDEHFVLVGAGRGNGRTAAKDRGRTAAAALDWPGAARAGVARHLSGGTRQKLNLVMSELGDPDVMLLDEPYQGFDKGSYQDFWEQVFRWRAERRAVVVVTHLLSELDRVDTVLDLTPAVAR